MSFSLTWLSSILAQAGLKVAPIPGWEERGRGDVEATLGVICHHTAGPASGNMPSLQTLIDGRSDLPGPLSQLGLGRDGTFYVIAAGRSNHAGTGSFLGITTGNSSFIGIEAEHTGKLEDEWPSVQLDAYARGVAAILKHIQRPVEFCIGHKEWAPGRKPDPTFDMVAFRKAVAGFLTGATPQPPLIPAAEAAPGGAGRQTLRRGASGDAVRTLQLKLQLEPVDSLFGGQTEAKVREFQRNNGLVPDGIVGPKTWQKLDAVP